MRYIDEFRDSTLAKGVSRLIAEEARDDRQYRFMEFCGGHTHAISRYGIEDLLPSNVQMIHGPGCPVCVLPVDRIDVAIRLAQRPGLTLCTYADLMRVPASGGASLMKAKAAGADIRMVYSPLDAIRIAESEPTREVVFFAIGFETTAPPTAMAISFAIRKKLSNFSVFCNHVLTPPAMRAILESDCDGDLRLDGFVGPSHVSAVIGLRPYDFVARQFRKPVVVAGFEPLDIMQAIVMLLRQANDFRYVVENQYGRAVKSEGNVKAQALMAETFETTESFEWRGLGALPDSALRLRSRYAGFNVESRFDAEAPAARDNPACECGAVLRGAKQPIECKLFGTVCTPESPMGSCMVSSEGACAAHWTYRRFSTKERIAS